MGVVSATLISGVSLWEGVSYKTYEDLAGIPTVCYGHTGNDIVRGKTYLPQECKKLLEVDLIKHRQGMFQCVNVPLTPNQADAFTMFTFNVGVNAFCKSSLLRELNKGNYTVACDGLLKWSYVGKTYVKGLNNRRQFERAMCLGK